MPAAPAYVRPDDAPPFELRPLQKEILEDKHRFKVVCCHRRFGKTVLAVEYLVGGEAEHMEAGRDWPYMGWFVFPYATQGIQIAWDMLLDQTAHIDGMHYDKRDMVATFPMGGKIRFVGAEQYNRHRGKRGDRVVFDEVSDIPPVAWRQVFRPMLSDGGKRGTALFIGTPRGHDWFKDLHDNSKRLKNWGAWHKTVYETDVIDPDEVDELREEMLPDEFRQEYLCDWDVARRGAFYQMQTNQMIDEGRAVDAEHNPDELVYTAWWMDDSDQLTVTIWQAYDNKFVCIEALHDMNASIATMCDKLLEREHYAYERHYAPFGVRPGTDRWMTASEKGIKLQPAPLNVDFIDRIELTKKRFSRIHMNRQAAANLIEGCRQYHAEFDEVKMVLKQKAVQNLAARYCESMASFFLGHRETSTDWSQPISYPERFRA